MIQFKRLRQEFHAGTGYYPYEVHLDGERIGVLLRAFDRHGRGRIKGWTLVLDHDPRGFGQTDYTTLNDARERIPGIMDLG